MLTKLQKKENHKKKYKTNKTKKKSLYHRLLLGFALDCCVGLRTIPKNPSRPTSIIGPMLVD